MKLVRAMISTREEDADPVGSATLLAARFTPLTCAHHSRLRAFPREPLLVMRGGRALSSLDQILDVAMAPCGPVHFDLTFRLSSR
jgi:hypothetical protein